MWDEQECCPGCGLPVLVSLHKSGDVGGLDARGFVVSDVACRQCGYNVRGLPRDGRCPECAAPISLSLREDYLCYAEPTYVARVARGVGWVVRAANLIIGMLLALLGLLILSLLVPWCAGLPGDLLDPLFVAGALAAAVLFLGGLWFATTRDPRHVDAGGGEAGRRAARLALIALPPGFALLLVMTHRGLPPAARTALVPVMLASWILTVVGVRGYFRHLEALARRIPSSRLAIPAAGLARNLPRALGALVVIYGTMFAIAAIEWLTGWNLMPLAAWPRPRGLAGFLGSLWRIVTGCGGTVALIALVFLTVRAERFHRALRNPLKQQADLARRHWEASAGE